MIATFVICFHTARIDNLLQTLRFLCHDHKEIVSNCHIELVCQNSVESLTNEPLEQLDKLRCCFKGSRLKNLNIDNMNLPQLTNIGVDAAPTDKVVILESDRLLPPRYFQHVLEKLASGIQITTKNLTKLTKPLTDDQIRGNEFVDSVNEDRSETNEIGRRNMWSGNTAILKEDYIKSGMMDENYKGYGWADNDMCMRTHKAGIKSVFVNVWVELHLWHPPATYGIDDQKELFINNGLYYCKKWGVCPLPNWFKEELVKHKGIMM